MRNLLPLVVLLSSQICYAQTVQLPVISQFGVQTSVMVPDRGGAFLGGVKRAGESSFNSIFSPIGSSVGRFSEHTGLSSHVFISDLREMDELILEAANRPDGLDYLRRIHSGVAFDNSISYGGGAISEVSPLAGRYPSSSQHRTTIPYRTSSTHSTAPRFSNRPTLPRSSSVKQAESDQFLADLDRSMNGPTRFTQQVASRTHREPIAQTTPKSSSKPVKNKLNAGRSYLLARKAERAGHQDLAILHYRKAAQFGSKVAEKRLRDLNAATVANK
jgi:hypothetical protein